MADETYSAMKNLSDSQFAAMVDMRSDTVTRPGAGMLNAMLNAKLGDDVYREDPSVNTLEQESALLLGKEAGLFVSSGTMGNLLALLVHCQRGQEFIAGANYHSYCEEAGGGAALGGVVPCPLAVDENYAFSLEQFKAAIKPDDPHYPVSKLLCLENTVSGVVQPTAHIEALADIAHTHGLKVHLDGARIMNAAVALSCPVSTLADSSDTVSFCLSKGLGAPVGAVLLGPQGFIDRARRLRKMLGGGTRQAGILAAAGLYALEHNIKRLAQDHENASYLAEGLGRISKLKVRSQTNMVFVQIPEEDIQPLSDFLFSQNILWLEEFSTTRRLVTHMDISRQDVQNVVDAVSSYFAAK